jgi:hypothetical protein
MTTAGRAESARSAEDNRSAHRLANQTLEDHEIKDFQDLPQWRELIPVFTKKIADFTGNTPRRIPWRGSRSRSLASHLLNDLD